MLREQLCRARRTLDERSPAVRAATAERPLCARGTERALEAADSSWR